MSSFDRLHPSIQHHIVNTLGWRSLRPLQEATIDPVMSGEHALLLAPTAGGKTEAAAFPVVSRLALENWRPLSVLYIAPLRALLNNLTPRLEQYAAFTGHRAALWHGDVGQGERARILGEPPDILLTTPESLEAMLISTRIDPKTFFRHLRTVVVDEVHAFASDDRGWHLLAVLARLERFAGCELQRLGLSATVGNPDEILDWLTAGSESPKRVISPNAIPVTDEIEVELDWVGTLDNAAKVIARLHRGEKRLVFVDSRARAEYLTSELLAHDVETFVSHGSLSRDERQRTEEAFAESRNCVIVATSTLELGVDIGDLDRVIQIDSPSTVASFLQRLGRTGRRQGATRNTLFLATKEDQLTQALGLIRLWESGFVESVHAPPFPAHLLGQQIMALVLQEHAIGESGWPGWLGDPHVFGADVFSVGGDIVDFMLAKQILFRDQGVLSFGAEGEAIFGRRHFMELMSAFTSEPVFYVRAGRSEIGLVPDVALSAAEANEGVLLLAGRHWFIESVDFRRRVITVTPAPSGGKIQFWGSGLPLSYELCQSMHRILTSENVISRLSVRADEKLAEDRAAHVWLSSEGNPVLFHGAGRPRWWTFAGLRANLELAARMPDLRVDGGAVDNFAISVDENVGSDAIAAAVRLLNPEEQAFAPDLRMVEGLKFHEALPLEMATQVARRRFADPAAIQELTQQPAVHPE